MSTVHLVSPVRDEGGTETDRHLCLLFVAPGHESVRNVPQNVAWLSLIKNAKKSVFMYVSPVILCSCCILSFHDLHNSQTPTFNASPVVPATIDACRRGVEVTLYLDLGTTSCFSISVSLFSSVLRMARIQRLGRDDSLPGGNQ